MAQPKPMATLAERQAALERRLAAHRAAKAERLRRGVVVKSFSELTQAIEQVNQDRAGNPPAESE